MYQTYQQLPVNPYAQNIAIIKNYFKKPIVLVTAIITAASIFVSFISSVISIPFLLKLSNLLQEIPELANSGITVNTNINIPILTVLSTVALFIIYSKSKNENPFSNPVQGFSILSVIALIELIGICLSIGALLLMAPIAMSLLFTTDDIAHDMKLLPIFLIMFCVVFIVILGISLIYSINKRRFYKGIKDSLTSPTLTTKGASVFGNISIVFGTFSILRAVSALFSVAILEASLEFFGINPDLINPTAFAPIFYLSAFESALSAVQAMMIGFIARGYKNYINDIAFSYSNTTSTYAQPTPTPAEAEINPFEITNDDATLPIENYRSGDTIVCPCCKKQLPKEIIFCDSCGNKVQ